MFYIFTLLLLLFLLSDTGHSILARQTLRDLGLSASADQYESTSAIVSSKSPYNRSHASSSTSTSDHQSLSFTNVPTPLPYPFDSYDPGGLQNWQDLNSGSCAVDDEYCSYEGFNKTNGKASITAFANQCLLWDASCVGNGTLAIEEFFNTTKNGLLDNQCFSNFDSGNAGIAIPEVPEVPAADNAATGTEQPVILDAGNSSDCKTYNPSERLSAWDKIKSWMRSPGCVSAQDGWVKMGGHMSGQTGGQMGGDPSNVSSSCCGYCVVGAQNVDLYYWPEPGINTSCLSIILNSVHPLDFGATTAGSPLFETYWACTAKKPVTSADETGINAADTFTTTTTASLITTAAIETIGSIFVKVPLINPWAFSLCNDVDTTPRGLKWLEYLRGD